MTKDDKESVQKELDWLNAYTDKMFLKPDSKEHFASIKTILSGLLAQIESGSGR